MGEMQEMPAMSMERVDHQTMLDVMRCSLYPGAAPASVELVLDYCRAAGLDPMQKPVHIVPMWDSKDRQTHDVVMPGIGLYRTQAARSGQLAGISEPEFGPDVTEKIGGVEITYPQWCRVTVKRRLHTGEIAAFTAVERWKENYAVKGGKERSIAPNAMWRRRTYGQLGKCAQAQALRTAFPEMTGAQPTADEMDGKVFEVEALPEVSAADDLMPRATEVVTGEVIDAPAAKPAPTATQAPPAPQPEPAPAQKAVTASAGAIKMVRIKAQQAKIADDEICHRFGLAALDDANVQQVNEILAWLRGSAK